MKDEKKPWGGRFEGGVHPVTEAFTESVSFDCRLAEADIRGSMAHARMLGETGVIPKEDARAIIEGLKEILTETREGRFEFKVSLEDVHMNVERVLTERIGPAGGRLHTARSRNDQVATDLRLWLRGEIDRVARRLWALRAAFLLQARRYLAGAGADGGEPVILPGYTHMQRAQPVLLSHHLLAYVEMFGRDAERLAQARRRVNVLPLGAGALAGTPYPLRPEMVADELGFEGVAANSLDAVSDRDFVIDFLAFAAQAMMHLSRWSEEVVLWSSAEFGYILLPDAFATGSSIMPQKKNPDVAELTRGRAGRVYGDLVALLTTMKALPLAYNRDMQEDKEPLFDGADTTARCLEACAHMTAALDFDAERMARAVSDHLLLATELADYLARRGVPFREAHEAAGRMVKESERRGAAFKDLPLEAFTAVHAGFGPDLYDVLTPAGAAAARVSACGTGASRVRENVARLAGELIGEAERLRAEPDPLSEELLKNLRALSK